MKTNVRHVIQDETGMFDQNCTLELWPEDPVTKYNQNHDARGRFAPSTGGAAGSVEGENYPMLNTPRYEEDELYDNEDFMDEHFFYGVEVENAALITNVINNPDIVSDERAIILASKADQIATAGKVRGLRKAEISPELTDAVAQCEMEYGNKPGEVISRLQISAHPDVARDFLSAYAADKEVISEGKLPWTASSHAKSVSGAYKATLVHEVGHAKLAEYTYSHPESTWAVKGEPHQGTKSWADTVKNAGKRGWEGPSEYAKTDLGEMFSESLATLTVKKTTGDKAVDDYVKGVWARDTSTR